MTTKPEETKGKKPYSAPKMVLLGNVRDLTLGSGSFTTERGGGKTKSM